MRTKSYDRNHFTKLIGFPASKKFPQTWNLTSFKLPHFEGLKKRLIGLSLEGVRIYSHMAVRTFGQKHFHIYTQIYNTHVQRCVFSKDRWAFVLTLWTVEEGRSVRSSRLPSSNIYFKYRAETSSDLDEFSKHQQWISTSHLSHILEYVPANDQNYIMTK